MLDRRTCTLLQYRTISLLSSEILSPSPSPPPGVIGSFKSSLLNSWPVSLICSPKLKDFHWAMQCGRSLLLPIMHPSPYPTSQSPFSKLHLVFKKIVSADHLYYYCVLIAQCTSSHLALLVVCVYSINTYINGACSIKPAFYDELFCFFFSLSFFLELVTGNCSALAHRLNSHV